MPRIDPDIFPELDPEFFDKLDLSAIPRLNPDIIPKLDPAIFPELDPAIIGSLTPADIDPGHAAEITGLLTKAAEALKAEDGDRAELLIESACMIAANERTHTWTKTKSLTDK